MRVWLPGKDLLRQGQEWTETRQTQTLEMVLARQWPNSGRKEMWGNRGLIELIFDNVGSFKILEARLEVGVTFSDFMKFKYTNVFKIVFVSISFAGVYWNCNWRIRLISHSPHFANHFLWRADLGNPCFAWWLLIGQFWRTSDFHTHHTWLAAGSATLVFLQNFVQDQGARNFCSRRRWGLRVNSYFS